MQETTDVLVMEGDTVMIASWASKSACFLHVCNISQVQYSKTGITKSIIRVKTRKRRGKLCLLFLLSHRHCRCYSLMKACTRAHSSIDHKAQWLQYKAKEQDYPQQAACRSCKSLSNESRKSLNVLSSLVTLYLQRVAIILTIAGCAGVQVSEKNTTNMQNLNPKRRCILTQLHTS